jgi:hypothetical protein
MGCKAYRDHGPRGTVAHEYRDFRLKARRIVQRACVDRMGLVLAGLSAEYQAAANRTGIAHGIIASEGLRPELSRQAGEANCTTGKPHERYEAGAGRFATITAVTVPRIERLTLGLIPHSATKTAARIMRYTLNHRAVLLHCRRKCGRVVIVQPAQIVRRAIADACPIGVTRLLCRTVLHMKPALVGA